MVAIKEVRFPVNLGTEDKQFPNLLAVGGEGSWVTSLYCTENLTAASKGVIQFNQYLAPDITAPLRKMLLTLQGHNTNYVIYYMRIGVNYNNNASEYPLYVIVNLEADTVDRLDYNETMIKEYVKFFVNGDYEVDWDKGKFPGDIDTPVISSFDIRRFGYIDLKSRNVYSLFDAP